MDAANLSVGAIATIGVFLGTFILMKLTLKEAGSISAIAFFSALLATFLVDMAVDKDLRAQVQRIADESGVDVKVQRQ